MLLNNGPKNITPAAWNVFHGAVIRLNDQLKNSPERLSEAMLVSAFGQVIRRLGKVVQNEYDKVVTELRFMDLAHQNQRGRDSLDLLEEAINRALGNLIKYAAIDQLNAPASNGHGLAAAGAPTVAPGGRAALGAPSSSTSTTKQSSAPATFVVGKTSDYMFCVAKGLSGTAVQNLHAGCSNKIPWAEFFKNNPRLKDPKEYRKGKRNAGRGDPVKGAGLMGGGGCYTTSTSTTRISAPAKSPPRTPA
jgi:hypothetical protein